MNILARYNVDTITFIDKINYSRGCNTIHIYRSLSRKDSLKGFNLDNWIIGSEHGELSVMKSKGKGAGSHPGARHP
jgi:hypothetical protein